MDNRFASDRVAVKFRFFDGLVHGFAFAAGMFLLNVVVIAIIALVLYLVL